MDRGDREVLTAVCRAAAELTGAASAAVFAAQSETEDVVVVAVAGPNPQRAVGEHLGRDDDSLAFVLAGGQAMSLAPASPESPGADQALICLPFADVTGAAGALELRRHPEGGPFSLEATRAGGLLAQVAAAALSTRPAGAVPPPAPEHLGSLFARLAARDPARYRAVAVALGALLGGD